MLQQGAGRVQPIVHDELREGHPLATPELLHGTPLARRMHEFTFFAYQANEALHMTAGEHIRRMVIDMAKERLMDDQPVSSVAYDLGFDYPQHMTRLFKKYVGCSPSEYVRKQGK